MGLELTTDRYPPMTSQTSYPLRHADSDGTLQHTFYNTVTYEPCFLAGLGYEYVYDK